MHFLTVIATFKNESLIIKEWLDHYIEQGVDHFYLIDNNSDDNYVPVLEPYKDKITIFKPSDSPKTRHVYVNDVFNQIRNDTFWIINCDITQYWYTVKDYTLREFLQRDHNCDVFNTSCFMFGNNKIIHQPKQIRTSFTQISEDTPIVKSIAKSSVIIEMNNTQHRLINGATTKIENSRMRVNDYGMLSLEYFLNVKMKRSHPDIEEATYSWSDFILQDNLGIDTILKDKVINALPDQQPIQ